MTPAPATMAGAHDAPEPAREDLRHAKLGAPCAVWTYHAADGALHHVRARYDRPDGGKDVLPWHRDGGRWRCREPKGGAFPLYNVADLIEREAAPVLVVEGEKTADAAARLFPDHAVTTSAGGSKAAAKSDWSAVHGRAVVIWPDHDKPGREYAEAVARLAHEAGTASVAIVAVPEAWPDKWPDKWDVADPLPEGVTADDLAGMIEDAAPWAPELEPPPVIVRRASEIVATPIRWLWPERFARGKVSLIGGHPGLGKSQLTCHMAAVVTTGGAWPDGARCDAAGDVVFLSAEDDAADTIKPRLMAAGADCERVHLLDAVRDDTASGGARAFNLKTDIAGLEWMLARHPIRLVVIDPISAYLGGTDSHVNADVRAMLAPLAEMAARHDAAIVAVTHFNKGGGGAESTSRFTGSIAFVAAARSAWIVAKEPGDEETNRRVFISAKNNIAKDTGGLAFEVEGATVGEGITTSRVAWREGVVRLHADDVLGMSARGEETSARGEAEEFIRDMLMGGRFSARPCNGKEKRPVFQTSRSAAPASGWALNRPRMECGAVGFGVFPPPKMIIPPPKMIEHAHIPRMITFDHLREQMSIFGNPTQAGMTSWERIGRAIYECRSRPFPLGPRRRNRI